ncbi:MAG: GntR family transcriptional regulator [Pseudomonadota bacterium]
MPDDTSALAIDRAPPGSDADGAPHAGAAANGAGPLFHQIATTLRDRIVSGELGAGARLPSEADICETWGVSRITAKRALDLLAEDGLVERARGRGTTVTRRAPAPSAAARLDGWLDNLWSLADVTTVDVLDFGYGPLPAHVARELELPPSAEAQHARRLRRLEGLPLFHLESWVPADVGRAFDAEALRTRPMLRLMQDAGVRIGSARQTVTATAAPPEVSAALGLTPGAPLLDMRRRVYDRDGRAVQFIRALHRPDLYSYDMELTAGPEL